MYTIEELTQAARKLFGYSGALVAAALRLSGKKQFTIEEAEKIVKAFANKAVE